MSNLILCLLCLSCVAASLVQAGQLTIQPDGGDGVVTWTKGDKNKRIKCRFTPYSRSVKLMLIRQLLDGSQEIVQGKLSGSRREGFLCLTYSVAVVKKEHAGIYKCVLVSKVHKTSVTIAVAKKAKNETETTTPRDDSTTTPGRVTLP